MQSWPLWRAPSSLRGPTARPKSQGGHVFAAYRRLRRATWTKARSCERSSFVRYCATSRAAWRSRTYTCARAVVAAAAFVAVLYVDVRRTVDVNLTTFGKELGRACAYVAPLYPLLAILCSLIFVPIMSVFEKAGWNVEAPR